MRLPIRCCLTAIAASLFMVQPGLAADKLTVRLEWSWVVHHSAILLAKEKGFYSEVDLDVEVLQGQGSKTTTMVVGEGTDPIGFASLSTAARSISAGVPITAVAGYWQKGPISIMCVGDDVKKPEDIKGKRVGSTPTGSDGQILPAFLTINNLSLADIALVNMPGDAKFASVASGQVDCISGDDYFYGPQIEGLGKGMSLLRYSDWGVTNLAFGIVVNNEYLAKNPDVVKRFLVGTQKGLEYVLANKDEAVKEFIALTGNLQTPEFSRSVLEAYGASLHTAATEGKPIGFMAIEDWKAQNDVLEKFGGMTDRKDDATYFTNDYLPQ